MRLLFFGDLASTGFGTVTMDLGRELLALGLDVRFVSQNEVDDLPEPFGSRTFRVDPSMTVPELAEEFEGTEGLGHTSLSLASTGIAGLMDGRLWKDRWTPEAALILGDFGNVRLVVLRDDTTRQAFASLPTFHYVPIEGLDIPPTLREMWSVVRPVAMAEFGASEIERVTGTRPPVIYHGVDTAQFRPFSPEAPFYHSKGKLRSKQDAKRAIGADPRARILFRADRNMPRKRYASLLRAMVPVLAARSDTYLILHCRQMDLGGDLRDTIDKYPARLRGRVLVTNGSVSRDDLTVLYNAADLYVSVSAEGFGLTIAEAMACGTPAVGIDYSAVPEVIGPGGVAAPIAGLIDNEYGYYWAAADEPRFAAAVGELLDDEVRRKQLARAGLRHVRESFAWRQAAQQFADLFRAAIPAEVAA